MVAIRMASATLLCTAERGPPVALFNPPDELPGAEPVPVPELPVFPVFPVLAPPPVLEACWQLVTQVHVGAAPLQTPTSGVAGLVPFVQLRAVGSAVA